VLLDVLEHVVVGVGDDEALAEDVNDGSDVQVLRSVVGRRLGPAARARHATPVQVLAAHEAGVADRRLVDGQSVVGQAVDEDETSSALLLPRVLLTMHSQQHCSRLQYSPEYLIDNSSTLHSPSRRALAVITGSYLLL